MQGIEIEKKYKIKQLPKDLEKYEKIEIEQAYLVNRSKITVRVRKSMMVEYYKRQDISFR